eukprot:7054689-Prymnesium_polylepis.1
MQEAAACRMSQDQGQSFFCGWAHRTEGAFGDGRYSCSIGRALCVCGAHRRCVLTGYEDAAHDHDSVG